MKRFCEYCDETATVAGLCTKHYNYAWRWHKAGVKRARDHTANLVTRARIMSNIAPQVVVPDNVVALSTHPKFAAKTPTRRSRRKRAAG